MAGEKRFLVADFLMSFMWVWSSVIIKILVHSILGYGFHDVQGELIRYGISVANMFLFALLAKLTILSTFCLLLFLVIFNNFLFTLGARIPAKVVGSIYGVMLILDTFLEIGRGPRLNIDITKGALTEGFLTFAISIISRGLAHKNTGSFFMNTWISSVSKLSLIYWL